MSQRLAVQLLESHVPDYLGSLPRLFVEKSIAHNEQAQGFKFTFLAIAQLKVERLAP
jgi:hypothetical protein